MPDLPASRGDGDPITPCWGSLPDVIMATCHATSISGLFNPAKQGQDLRLETGDSAGWQKGTR